MFSGVFDRKRSFYVHRLSYELFRGEILKGMCVCHDCDWKICTNPAHFFLGTRDDNNKDAAKKNRMAYGMMKPNTKLTNEQVMEIRGRYAAGGIFQRELATMFGIDQGSVSRVLSHEIRRHLP